MRNAIQQRGRHLGVAEDLDPLPKIEVGGDDQRGFLIQMADQVEQQCAAGCGERQVAQFIQNHRIHNNQLLGQIAGLALLFFLIQLIDQIDRVIKSHAFSLVNGRYAKAVARWVLPVPVPPTRIKL